MTPLNRQSITQSPQSVTKADFYVICNLYVGDGDPSRIAVP
jgi:hypothetical protein